MEIPLDYMISDIRNEKDFMEKTFCGYLRKEVLSVFNKSLLDGKIEVSCNWAIELLCSGCVDKIYDKFYTIIMKHINVNNLELLNIYYNRYVIYTRFKSKMGKLELRNSQNIRNHIVELSTIICLSMKGKALTSVKITDEMFNIDYIKCKLSADKSTYIDKYYRFGDPKELKMFFNEFIYSLVNMRLDMAIFWLYWLIEWEKKNIKKEKTYQCGYRSIENIDKKYMTDMVWIIWEILLNLNNNVYINSLFKLYRFEYSPSKKHRKISIIIVAIKIYTDIKGVINGIDNSYKPIIIQACGNVNNLFIERKSYEISKKMDDIHASNLETHNNLQASPPKKNLSKRSNKKIHTISELDTLMLTNLSK
jgi:hypothetical protein